MGGYRDRESEERKTGGGRERGRGREMEEREWEIKGVRDREGFKDRRREIQGKRKVKR